MTQTPLKILLGPELWQDDFVAALVGMGHTVSVIPGNPDVVIGYNAWRIPPGTKPAEVFEHTGMILKQVRATKHVQDQEEGSTPIRVDKKPKKSPARKRAAETASSSPPASTTAEGQPSQASNNARPARKRGSKVDGETQDKGVQPA